MRSLPLVRPDAILEPQTEVGFLLRFGVVEIGALGGEGKGQGERGGEDGVYAYASSVVVTLGIAWEGVVCGEEGPSLGLELQLR